MPAHHQYCTFFLAERCYGLDVLKVQEIVRSQPITPVPLSSPAVRGLINLRGQIVTAIDLRRRLSMPDLNESKESVNVVVQTDDGAVSLVVDEIGDVLDVSESQFEHPPETLNGSLRELIQGAYTLPDRLLVILDLDRVIRIP